MINIYSDGRDCENKLQFIVNMLAGDDILILVGDGIMNAVVPNCLSDAACRIYVLENDLTARGFNKTKIGEIITIEQMVDLIANDLKSPISW